MSEHKLYLIGYEPGLFSSMKMLLETHSYSVIPILDINHLINTASFDKSDAVLLDLNVKNPAAFKLFNALVSLSRTPKIIISADRGFNFRPSDVFFDGNYDILFHPISPTALLQVICRNDMVAPAQ